MKDELSFPSNSKPTVLSQSYDPYGSVVPTSSVCKKWWIMAVHISVMISIVFQWPWQTVHGPSLERQHWQQLILEQTKRLSRIMGCCCRSCHLRGRHVQEQQRGTRWGFVWTWPLWIRHPLWPWKMKLEKGRKHTKAGIVGPCEFIQNAAKA